MELYLLERHFVGRELLDDEIPYEVYLEKIGYHKESMASTVNCANTTFRS